MNKKKVAIIGCGNLGTSIANGLLVNKDEYDLIVTRRNTNGLEPLKKKGATVTSDNIEACMESDIILLSLKPYNIQSVLSQLKGELKDKIVVSLATGVSTVDLKSYSRLDHVFRAMPNTATDVKESITCLCSSKQTAMNEDVITLFNKIGATIEIDEDLMDSATILGACGIAYAMRFIRAMIQGGIEIGFDASTAGAIVNQTVKGAAQLLLERKHHPEFEIDKVTTPKGCTIVGLNEMEHNGFSSSLIKGIVSSYDKINS